MMMMMGLLPNLHFCAPSLSQHSLFLLLSSSSSSSALSPLLSSSSSPSPAPTRCFPSSPPLPRPPPCFCPPKAPCSSHSSSPNQDYLSLSDKELAAQCEVDTFRASGPGGQHRNKTESAVRFKHIPTGLLAQASDDRSQHKNRAYALDRLRQQIAIKVRRPVELTGYKAPPQLVRILPAAKGQRIGPNHPDFAQGIQALLDLLSATRGSVSDAAALLGLSTGVFSKVITSDKTLMLAANELRSSQGLKPLH